MGEIDYHFSITPYVVNDGVTIPYFVSHGFNTAILVVPDTGIYSYEINKLKEAGLKVIVDIEQPIWAGGNNEGTPISAFTSYFQQLKDVGVTRVSSEGGRDGDLDVIGQYFEYVNLNCDQCGLWKGFYKHPATVMNSWESYYTSEMQYIQQGVREAAPLGKKSGILTGIWDGADVNPMLVNTRNGVSFNYYDEAAWMDTNGGLDHFAVWAGLNNEMLARYKLLGFEPIVAKMQSIYPPRGSTPAPAPQTATMLTLAASTTTPDANTNYNIFGVLTDSTGKALTNKPVDLWVRHDDDNGKLWKTMTTDGAGKFSTVANSARTAYVRTVFKGDSAYIGSKSNLVTIKPVIKPAAVTTIDLSVSDTHPLLGDVVTFTAQLKAGDKPLADKSLLAFHNLCGAEFMDQGFKTDANGKVVYKQDFRSHCLRICYMKFAGDADYAASESNEVNIYATAPLTMSNI